MIVCILRKLSQVTGVPLNTPFYKIFVQIKCDEQTFSHSELPNNPSGARCPDDNIIEIDVGKFLNDFLRIIQ